jgi:hypothetical protein
MVALVNSAHLSNPVSNLANKTHVQSNNMHSVHKPLARLLDREEHGAKPHRC